jgi:hypothetical protein
MVQGSNPATSGSSWKWQKVLKHFAVQTKVPVPSWTHDSIGKSPPPPSGENPQNC